ncbi:MAG TPA: LytTR family DNA-binding domain-containing protein [Gemmatimonadales bacterium]|nr:LytTR family DNA-binding domain-containing protein [Gemmatimonadales bacterium]
MSGPAPLRVLVVDDELPARQRLEDLLRRESGVTLVGEADNGPAAIEAIRRFRPDLVFLDIQMPGRTGLEVLREIGPESMPATILVTAYDQYALAAFDLAAVDYLLKPFDDERFEQAFQRARRLIAFEEIGRLRDRLLAVLEHAGAGAPPARAAGGYLDRIPVTTAGETRVVPVSEIEYITASGPYARLHAGAQRYVIREAMQVLEESLDPARFMRIHRSAIVRVDLVESVRRGAGGDYRARLRNGVRLRVSRSRREALERRLGIS